MTLERGRSPARRGHIILRAKPPRREYARGTMKFRARPLLAAFALSLAAACGGAPAPSPITPVQGPAEPAVVGSAPMERGDLSPVPAPRGLIAVGRAMNVDQSLQQLSEWTGFPVSLQQLLQQKSAQLAQAIQLDAPVELALALDDRNPTKPDVRFVATVPLRSLEAAAAAAQDLGARLEREQPGIYRLVGSSKGMGDCRIASAVGQAPARLVCSDSQRSLEALLPYAVRGLPSEALPAHALQVEFRVRQLTQAYDSTLRQLRTAGIPMAMSEVPIDDPKFIRGLSDALNGVADELLTLSRELETVRLTADLDAQAGALDVSLTARLSGEGSYWVRTLLENAQQPSPPALFWKLPADAVMAGWGHGAKKTQTLPITKSISELSEGALQYYGISAKVRAQLTGLLDALSSLEGSSAWAYLPGPEGASPAKTKAPGPERGILVLGFSAGQPKVKAVGDRALQLWNDAALWADLKKKLGVRRAALPTAKARPTQGLAKATTYELSIPAQLIEGLDPSVKSVKYYVVLSGDGGEGWAALGFDEAYAVAQLKRLGAPGTATFATRPEARALSVAGGLGGGILNLGGLAQAIAQQPAVGPAGHELRELQRALAALPTHGEAPLLYDFTAERAGGVQLRWRLRIPKATLKDIGSLAAYLGGRVEGPPMPGAGATHPM